MSDVSELLETCRTISFCWSSRADSWIEEMLGCGGNEGSIEEASFDLATEEGRVSGSKRAFKMRLSFVLRLVSGISMAMMDS